MSRLTNRNLYGRSVYPIQGYKLTYQGGNPFYNYAGWLGEAADAAATSAKVGAQFAAWLKANPEAAAMGKDAAVGLFQRAKGLFKPKGEEELVVPESRPPEAETPTWMYVAGGVGVVALLGLGYWALTQRGKG